MSLIVAVLMGLLIIPATLPALPDTLQTSPPEWTQANTADKKALDEQLIEAIRADHVEEARALLQKGASANGSDGLGQPLYEAVNRNALIIVRLLIEADAQVKRSGLPFGWPLKTAAQADHAEMVRLLLSLGADVNGGGPGNSPLWSALVMNRLEVARILIAAGADVNAEKAYAENHHMPEVAKRLEKALGPTPPATTVEQVVSRLEAEWDSRVLGDSRQHGDRPSGAEVARTSAELRARLKAQPRDTQAPLLWARFALVPFFFKTSTEYDPSASQTESLPTEVALDRVLVAEPHNAEALYLKGRLYAEAIQAKDVTSKRNESGQAILFFRQAVEIAPANVKYREFLALYLADHGQPGEGKKISRAAQQNHPMIPLLEDLESLSVPEGGELVNGNALSMNMMITLGEAGAADYLPLRLRTYHYAKSPAEIEAFYASRIPGFRFIPENQKGQDSPTSEDEMGQLYQQFLHVKPGSMNPTRQRSALPDARKAKDGIMMELFEMNEDLDLQRKLSPGEHSCYLILANYRK